MSVTYRLTLDLARETDSCVYGLKVGESGEKIFKVALNENGRALRFEENESVVLQIKKPDDNIVLRNATRVGNLCTFAFSGTLTQQLTAAAGECEAEVVVSGDNYNKSCRFSIIIEEGVISEEEIESTSFYADFEETKEVVEEVALKVNKMNPDVACSARQGNIINFAYTEPGGTRFNSFECISALQTLCANKESGNYYIVTPKTEQTSPTLFAFSDYQAVTNEYTPLIYVSVTNSLPEYLYIDLIEICFNQNNEFENVEQVKQKIKDTKADAIFNINTRIEYNAVPLIVISEFQCYNRNGVLINESAYLELPSSTSAPVYLYKNNNHEWALSYTQPSSSSYTRTPVFLGDVVTKTVNGSAEKYFVSFDNSEAMFNVLNVNKVDKETGKGLSTNDYTTAEKTKLYGIESGAEANVQSDWNENDSTKDGFIKNKPQNLVSDSNYVHTDNNFNNDYKSKIETNEYNDIFNIRVEWDREYMPRFELIIIYYQYYAESGRLTEDTASYDVKDITNGDVYLYKDTSDQWAMAVGTPPSSYHRLPMLVGNIATKTVNGESVKLFFRNGDDETQFDRLNNEKVDKVSGKGLSTNDFTNEYKNKVDNIAKENYVLIKDFTVETETPDVTFTTDSDETTALNLKSARIYIEIPPTSSSGIVRIQLKKTSYSPAIVYTYEGNGISASTRVKHLLETYQNKGFWQTVYSMNGNARGMLPDYMNVAVDNTLDYIGRIQISSTTSGLNFPVNTKIKVWGVRV